MKKQEMLILFAVSALLAAAGYLLVATGADEQSGETPREPAPAATQSGELGATTSVPAEAPPRSSAAPNAVPKPPVQSAPMTRAARPTATRPATTDSAARPAKRESFAEDAVLVSADPSSGVRFTITQGSSLVRATLPRKMKVKSGQRLSLFCVGYTELIATSQADWDPGSRTVSQKMKTGVLPKRLKPGQVVKNCQLFGGKKTRPLATAGFSALPAPSAVYQKMMTTHTAMAKALRSGKSWKAYCSHWVAEQQEKCRKHFARIRAKIKNGKFDVMIQPMGIYRQGVGSVQVRDSKGAFDQILFLRQRNGSMRAFHAGVAIR